MDTSIRDTPLVFEDCLLWNRARGSAIHVTLTLLMVYGDDASERGRRGRSL